MTSMDERERFRKKVESSLLGADGFGLADAILELLGTPAARPYPAPVPDATVPTPAYPRDSEGRPLWVRLTDSSFMLPHVRPVKGWRDGRPVVPEAKGDGALSVEHSFALWPDSWEPCAAPAETPAAAQDAGLTEAEVRGAGLAAYDALPSDVKCEIDAQHPRYCYARGWDAALAALNAKATP